MERSCQILLELPPPETIEFFVVFSRFEYALKCSGHLTNGKGNEAKADWDKFADRLGKPFLNHIRRSNHADKLLEKPPKKQVMRDGKVEWKEVTPIKTAADLFCAIRRVRNNLFHGGKYSTGPVEEIARNKELLSSARWVLIQALEESPKVRTVFCEPL